jgi:hypothetical protein
MSLKNRKHQPQQQNEDDHDNDALLNALLQDVQSLKGNANDIGGELKEHSTLFDRISVRLGRARDSIMRTTNKLTKSESMGGHVSHVWILLIFAFVVFVFIYLMLKFKR